ncbi:CYTH domain-containing protein [Endozoicomonas sp. SCSIO W0465]|uniref:CYTH domain-containing protein n=1 Tax=Endozoicomonas sp. SCSIO W0465 TaxID=2918516 RepID=UPI00207584BE|nr:CYTH domain-containing protein [Endozoicomonas sp. SCSIO W0465]USE37078.1 CYTH domain-containing protein [Endozoicomonas sp. SCSIO W0465]
MSKFVGKYVGNMMDKIVGKKMGQETELKLSVPAHQIELLKSHPFWQEHAIKPPETLHLGNTYFDTPDLRLNQAKVALRIREVNGQYIQTLKTQALKTRGESVNGLTRRGEWEWPLSVNGLNGQVLPALWPAELSDISVAQLKPLFTTDFYRTRWLLVWQSPFARVEAALDRGSVKSGNNSSPICELELELIEGDESALIAISNVLKCLFELTPSDQSKAEKGFKLIATKSLPDTEQDESLAGSR